MCNSVCANSSSRILRKTTSSQASSGRTSGVNISLCLEHRVFIKQIEMRELRMRLLHPFETSFGSTQDRHVIVVKVRDGKEAGWGEVTAAEGPFYSYETWETAWHLLRDFIAPRVVGKEFEEPTDFASLVRGIRGHNMARAGLETAVWDLEAKIKNVPLWKRLGGSRQRIECGVSIGINESIHSAEDARKAIKIGACKIINIKLGRVGGYGEARAVHDVCRDYGIPVWCGGMLESGIGRAHNVALSSLVNFALPGDVSASKRYWPEDIIDPPVEVSADGQISQSGRPGIGYSIKEDLIERLTVRSQVFTA